MSKSTRRPQHIFTIIMWILSLVFAGFLIGMGSLIIKDLRKIDAPLKIESFLDAQTLAQINSEQETLKRTITQQERQIEDARTINQSAQEDYNTARVSLDNWLQTRTATQASNQNPEVIARNRQVDTLNIRRRETLNNLITQDQQLRDIQRRNQDINIKRREMRKAAQPKFRAAQRSQNLRIFLFRLTLTLPLLIIAVWMVKTRRKSSYWPLYRGFILFALFAFFIELVPYLPSYGGYVRFGVGIGLVLIVGHFTIQGMRTYLTQKQLEEQRSESERRQSIGYETALKKIAAKTCPGCDRSIITRDDIETDFCVHCGIRLQRKCTECGERNISFHRFCLSCGTPSPQINPSGLEASAPVSRSGLTS